jgi:disulfide bond formation protein DsbB
LKKDIKESMSIIRKLYLAGIIIPWILIGIAYFYFQLYLDLIPCPLCMFQRAALAAISLVSLIAFCYSPSLLWHKIYSAFAAIFAAVGLGIAGRQVWLQHLPADQVPQCGFDPVYRWMESEPGDYNFMQMVATTLKGSGDCAHIDWSFLSLSIAGWMVVIFSIIFVFAANHVIRS